MAELGHDVVGVDIDAGKLEKLSLGTLSFYEPGLSELVRKNLSEGRLRFTASYREAAEFANVHFIAVGTPQKDGELGADLRYVNAVVETLAPLLCRAAVIFGKSTVPAGTAARLGARVRALAPASDGVELAWNPEFLREGFAIQDTLRPDRIIIGVDRNRPGSAEAVARKVYASQLKERTRFLVTDLATAELAKLAANAFLATKISFINAISDVCEATGADVSMLADAIGCDGRVGRRFLNAGIGFGGGCLPKDIRAFMALANEVRAARAFALVREVDSINKGRRSKAVEIAVQAAGGSFAGARVAVLGAAFKPNSDDVRDSPALDIAAQIQAQGASVSVYDPKAMDNARVLFPTLRYAPDVSAACVDADVVMILTEWEQFSTLKPDDLAPVVRRKTIFDGRNCLDPCSWRESGWNYRGIGRP